MNKLERYKRNLKTKLIFKDIGNLFATHKRVFPKSKVDIKNLMYRPNIGWYYIDILAIKLIKQVPKDYITNTDVCNID